MNKKILTIIISLILALALIAVAIVVIIKGFNSKKGDDAQLSDEPIASQAVSEVSSEMLDKGKILIGDIEATVGSIVEIPIEIKQNPGIWGGQIILSYDTKLLDYVNFDVGNVFDECNVNVKPDGTVYCVATNSKTEDVRANGTIATLKFVVKPAAKGKTVKIDISDKSNFTNLEEMLIEPSMQSGKIKVE